LGIGDWGFMLESDLNSQQQCEKESTSRIGVLKANEKGKSSSSTQEHEDNSKLTSSGTVTRQESVKEKEEKAENQKEEKIKEEKEEKIKEEKVKKEKEEREEEEDEFLRSFNNRDAKRESSYARVIMNRIYKRVYGRKLISLFLILAIFIINKIIDRPTPEIVIVQGREFPLDVLNRQGYNIYNEKGENYIVIPLTKEQLVASNATILDMGRSCSSNYCFNVSKIKALLWVLEEDVVWYYNTCMKIVSLALSPMKVLRYLI